MIMLRLLSTHHLWVNWQRNPCFIEKSLLIVTMYQSKSPYDIVNLHLWSEKEFLNLDTFKRCDMIGYKDSSLDLSKCFKMITWLQWFLCQLSHWWWEESNWSVISCGFPMMSVMMSIILPARRMCRVNYFRIFIITLFV